MNYKKWLVVIMITPALAIAACAGDDAGSGIEAVTETTADPDPADGGDDPNTTDPGGGSTDPDCPYQGDPVIDPSTLTPCPSYVCEQGGHCIPNGLVPGEVAGYLTVCNKDTVCVPDSFIESNGNFLLQTCTAVLGLEGRCLSSCVGLVKESAERLNQDICSDGDLCVPCFDPFSLESTGVCGLTCDPGPAEPPPEPLPSCCPEGNGTCIPSQLVPPESSGSINQESCPDSNDLCVPTEMLDPLFDPEPCEPDLLLQMLGIDDGACVPDCVEAVKSIGKGSCPSGYKCAPCDVFGEDTGACGEIW